MDVFCRNGFVSIFCVYLLILSGCASHSKQSNNDGGEAAFVFEDEKNPDPWEGYNRGVSKFNDTLDRWLLKPVAQSYHFVAPTFVETGVNNFFSNLGEVGDAVNNVLQWKWKKAGNSTGRFLVNSTVGVAGLFDVAKYAGMKKKDSESFGQTLSYWGVGPGPYFVIPFLGPSTLTDTISLPVDWAANPLGYAEIHPDAYLGSQALGKISARANLLALEELLMGDRYVFIREAYLQRRNYLVHDGDVEDDFGSDDDFDDDF